MNLRLLFRKFIIILILSFVAVSASAQVDVYRDGIKVATLDRLSDFKNTFSLQNNDVIEFQSDMELDVAYNNPITLNFVLNGNGHRLIFKEGAGTLVLNGDYVRFNNLIVDGEGSDFHNVVFRVENDAHIQLGADVYVRGFENSLLIDVENSLVTGGCWENNSSSSSLANLQSSTLSRVNFINNNISGTDGVSLFRFNNSTIVNSIVAENAVSASSVDAKGCLFTHIADDCSIINSTFVNNSVDDYIVSDGCKIHNSILYQTGKLPLSDVLDHCVTDDPKINSDYTLRFGSPCIDAGDNDLYNNRLGDFGTIDFGGEERFMGGSIDVGACEYRKRCEGEPLSLDIISTSAKCFGVDDGEITGNITGGIAPYTVTWLLEGRELGKTEDATSIDITGLADGYYKVVVTDALGCEKSKTLLVEQLSQKITVKAADSIKVYDGTPLTQSRYEVDGDLEEGDIITDVVIEGTITAAGTVENVMKSFRIMRGEQDITCYYDTAMTNGVLTVNKRKLTIYTLSTTRDYNGEVLRLPGVKTKESLAEGDVVSATVTGSITNVGRIPNAFSDVVIKRGEEIVTDNYDITTDPGFLEVTPLDVTVMITGAEESSFYNGTEQSVTGYSWIASSKLYKAADFTYAGDSTAKGTDVNTYAMGLDADDFSNTNDNFDVTFEVGEDGSLTITKQPVTVTVKGHSNSVVYNGAEQSVTGYDLDITSTLYAATNIEYAGDSTAKGTDVNTYAMDLDADDFSNTNDNFDVTFEVGEDGSLTITKQPVTVTVKGHSKSVVYNGAEQSVSGYDLDINSTLYVAADIEYVGDSTAKGTDVNTYTMDLDADDFSNTNDNFDVTFEVGEDGSLTITKQPVTVTVKGHSNSVVYNGAEQSVTGYDLDITSTLYAATNIEYAGDSTAKGTDVNTYAMDLDADDFSNTNDNFDVTFEVGEDGSLTITKQPVTVTVKGHSNSVVYNGAEQSVTGYDLNITSGLYSATNIEYAGDSTAKGTDAGTYGMGLDADDFTNTNANFEVTFEIGEDGALTITKQPVTVTVKGHSNSVVYNGAEQSVTGYDLDITSTLYAATNIEYAGDSTARGTDVNTYAMGLAQADFANKNNNFDVTFQIANDGALTISKQTVTVTVTGHSKSTVYNGAEQSVTGYDLDINSGLYSATNIEYAGDSTAKGTDAGTYEMGLDADDFANTNDNFDVTFEVGEDGSLTITPLDVVVEITGNAQESPYNGKAQKVSGFVINPNTDLYHWEDFYFEGDSLVTATTIGSYPMNLESTQFSNHNPNFGEVEFKIVADGSLRIVPIATPITITANSSKITYDGSPLSEEGFRYTQNVLVSGDRLTAVVEGSITNVGEIANVVTSYQVIHTDAVTNEQVDVTENYTFATPVDGKLTVMKRSVLLRSESAEKTYDGQPLTNKTVAVVGDMSKEGFVYGEGAAYDVTGTITEVGSVENEFTYKLRSNTQADNYDIKVEYGALTVLRIEEVLVVTANSNSKMYDGTPLVDDGFSYTPDILAKGDVIEAQIVGEVTQVGSAKNQVKEIKVVRGAVDVTSNYTLGESEDGWLTVTPRAVVLTSATDSKVYDREPLANGEITVGGDGFAPGEGASFVVPNSITEPGSVTNAFTYALNENTLADNYEIKTIEGLLTVLKRPTAILFDYGYAVKADTLGGFADEGYIAPSDPVRKGYDFQEWMPQLPELLPLDTLTAKAQWNLLTYTVTLDTFTQFNYTVEDDKTFELSDYAPVREGYDFMGWADASGRKVERVESSDAQSVTLTATWKISTFHIDYLSDGELWKRVPLVFGSTVTPASAPVRIGYLFNGWEPSLPATMPAKNLTVEADWDIITFNLFLMDEGRDAGAITYTVEDADFYLDRLEDRPGQEFSGWTLDGELLDYDETSDRYVFHPSLVASDVTLEAAWTIVSNEFTLEYRVDDVKYKSYRIMAGARTRPYVTAVRAPQAKAGYQFDGWDIDVPETMPRKNLVANAVWKPIVYRLVLRNEAGREIYSTSYTVEDEVLLPQLEDSEGRLEFLGWSDGAKTYTEFDPKKFLANVELVEVWKKKSFQVIYYVGNDEYMRDTFCVGDSIIKQPDPENLIEGYAFSGWSEMPTYMPTRDVRVTSYYERGGYTLTYMSEGREVKKVRYLYNASISPSRGISKYGYEFKYWAGVPEKMPAKDIEVEAVYDVATYFIALKDGEKVVDTLYYTIYDQDIILPSLNERGKVFRGWNDGRQNITKIKTGSYANNLELVANWLYINYTLIFEVDGVQYSKKNNMRCGDVIALPAEPEKSGTYFVRWEGLPDDGLMPDADLTVRALFSTQVGMEMTEDRPVVEVYAKDRALHILHAEGKTVRIVDLNGVICYVGTSDCEDFTIPMRHQGLYVVRVGNDYRKVIVGD